MLGTLPNQAKINWPEYVTPLVHAYSCTKSNMIGFSPYLLLYRWHPMLPIYIEFGVQTPVLESNTTHMFAKN